MQTVNFPCTHCRKVMAVGAQHLGKQVRCPHCRQVVTAPAAAAAPAAPAAAAASPAGSQPGTVPVPSLPPQPMAPVGAGAPGSQPLSVPPPIAPPPMFNNFPPGPSRDEHESIFGEHIDEDDLFGGNRPKLEVPPEQPPSAPSPPPLEPTMFQVPAMPQPPANQGTPMPAPMMTPYTPEPPSVPGGSAFGTSPATYSNGAGVALEPPPVSAPSYASPSPLVSSDATRTPTKNNSQLLLLSALIILLPYALFITLLAVYFYFKLSTIPDPREVLPDWGNPPASKGGPAANAGGRNTLIAERFKPDQPLPPTLVTKLNNTLKVGDLEVTPLGVELSRLTVIDYTGTDAVTGRFTIQTPPEEALVLKLKLKNTSKDTFFAPCDPAYDYRWRDGKDANDKMPYTYVEVNGRKYCNSVDRRELRFDLNTHWPKWNPDSGLKGQEEGFKVLEPGKEITTFVATNYAQEYSPVRALQTYRGPLTWRVQLRRGMVPSKDKEVSATAQIGVEFDAADIKGSGKPQ